MTYNVSSGTLNSTIPYLVFRLFTEILNEVHSSDDIQFSQNGTWTVKSVSSYKPLDDSRSPVVHSVIGLYSLYLHCYHAVAVRHNTLYRIVPCVTFRAPSIPIFPIFLSVPIIFLYFDEIPIFSYIIFTPKKCRDTRMSRHLSYAKMFIVNIKN